LLLLCATPSFAQLAQYGYVVGTLEPNKSFLEKLDAPDKGKYLHYHIFLLTAANVEYEVVIDVNDVSPSKPLLYRWASLNGTSDADFGPLYGASSDFHLISNTQASYGPLLTPNDAQKQAAGALDYIRHPGLLKAIRDLPWQQTYAQTTADPLQWSLPAFDNVFKNLFPTKVYVFGAPFTTGHGMHVVHQNQADQVAGYAATNGTWQDGGVIIERHIFTGVWFTVRSALMVKFANQTDFTAESNDLAKPAAPGHLVTPTTDTHTLGLICGDYQDFGPIAASQLEVTTTNAVAEPYGPNSSPAIEVHVKNGAFTDYNDAGDFTLTDYATNSAASSRVFARAYSPILTWYLWFGGKITPINIRSDYYVRVHAIDPNSYCDSGVGATLNIAHY
jgi:hypothetical protein